MSKDRTIKSKIRVCDTTNRSGARDDYIIRINPAAKRWLRLRINVAAGHHKKILRVTRNFHELKGEESRTFFAPARLVTNQIKCPPSDNNDVFRTEAEVDLTIRLAIGIREDYHDEYIELHRLKVPVKTMIADRLSRFFGRRYVFCRVCAALAIDSEKKLARASNLILTMLGISEGDQIVVEAAVKQSNEKIYLMTGRMQLFSTGVTGYDERKNYDIVETHPLYVKPEKILDLLEDVPRIYMDKEMRDSIGIDVLDSVRVRRSIISGIKKDLFEFGAVVSLSILATFQLAAANLSAGAVAGYVLISISVAAALVLIRMRSKLKG